MSRPALAPVLSDAQLFVLEMAGAIVATRSSTLSDEELEVLAEAAHLLRIHGRAAPIADRHWAVIGRTVGALLATGERPALRPTPA